MQSVARVLDGTVVNIEVVETADIGRVDDDGSKFVAYTSDNPAHVGFGYDAVTGAFEQPPFIPPPLVK